jgi:hypothetical protein
VEAQSLLANIVLYDYQKMPVRLHYISTGKRLISLVLFNYGLLALLGESSYQKEPQIIPL